MAWAEHTDATQLMFDNLVAPLLAMMRHLQHQLAYSDERITALAQTDERVRRVQNVRPERRAGDGGSVRAGDRCPALPPGARGRGLPRAGPARGELGGDAAPRTDHQSGSSRVRWLLIHAALDAPPPRCAHGGLAGLGHTDRGATGQGDCRRGPRAPARRNPLRAPARSEGNMNSPPAAVAPPLVPVTAT